MQKQLQYSRDSSTSGSSRFVTPALQPPSLPLSPQIAAVGEQLKTDYQVHEMPSLDTPTEDSSIIIVSGVLLSRIKYLECENACLKSPYKENTVTFKLNTFNMMTNWCCSTLDLYHSQCSLHFMRF